MLLDMIRQALRRQRQASAAGVSEQGKRKQDAKQRASSVGHQLAASSLADRLDVGVLKDGLDRGFCCRCQPHGQSSAARGLQIPLQVVLLVA